MRSILFFAILLVSVVGYAKDNGYLIKFKNSAVLNNFQNQMLRSGQQVKDLKVANWVKVDLSEQEVEALRNHPDVAAVEKNQVLKIMTNIEVHDPVLRAQAEALAAQESAWQTLALRATDNPDIPLTNTGGSGSDPNFSKQWGMIDNDVKGAWSSSGTKGSDQVVVAVIDTGVDYTHEDIIDNLWRNPGEMGVDANGKNMATNGIDDDGNGYVDDVVGWDFASNDNKPYDLASKGFAVLTGGNPGHGTHCAGNVAARGDNGKGIAGVAPNVKIMAMRFLTEKGQGTTEGAINAVRYAVDNGAQILSNSWGSEGDGDDPQGAQALKDVINYAKDRGVLFVAAAGNGHQGVGYDNDTDAKPGVPASYDMENIVSVAALDSSDQLGAFSNWGRTTVDIGAPGVKVYSTVPDNDYQDTVIDIPGFITATWDGTSMATPHVAGAAALYLSKNPNADWREIKDALLRTSSPVSSLNGKSVSGGKLNVRRLMQ
ncbi:MAG: S8 family serine peptidase [Bdellovibrionales bacterium]|nr:S8 family serine peptidase [Bdellovibrionales bacterium]